MKRRKRIGIFGWGVVAPRSPDIVAFERNLARPDSWLTPFQGFGPSNFLVGEPDFDFSAYRPWFGERFPPARYSQIDEKMGPMAKYAIGAFIQACSQNPGIEGYLSGLGPRCHVYVGTGLGDITVMEQEARSSGRARARWNEFWASPSRCSALRAHHGGAIDPAAPADPARFSPGSEDWIDAKHAWEAYWADRSDALAEYLHEAAAIHAEPVPPSSDVAKLGSIRQKLSRIRALNRKWECPEEPWASVSANLLWNIANVPAAQISMIAGITGPAIAPVAACATFGVTVKLAIDAIRAGDATAAVIGATDPPPHPMFLSAFYNANVLAADQAVSRPLTGLKGTHLSGGACIWVVGDAEEMTAKGYLPLGLEIVDVGVSSDAHHIITPSSDGPRAAMQAALNRLSPREISTWDMHATATPGDASEIEMSLEALHKGVVFTARKGTFGHGMSVAGGWELTAQHLCLSKGWLFPVALEEEDVHPDIRRTGARLVLKRGHENPAKGYAGKLSMGIGGINSCVISRAWETRYARPRSGRPASFWGDGPLSPLYW